MKVENKYIYYTSGAKKPYRVIITHKRKKYEGGSHETLDEAIQARNELLKKVGKCIDPDLKRKMIQTLENLEDQVEQFTVDFNDCLSTEKVNTCRYIQRQLRQMIKS